jgi:uncharacterized protein YbjT (DUF2867 family)
MKYIITGSLGNISKPLTQTLVAAGHQVTVISSKTDKITEIEAIGAKAAIGSVEDLAFLTKTFSGADAAYIMVPPKWDAADWKGYIAQIGQNYAAAIKASSIKKVVTLSSVGAHLPEGCGPVSGIYFVEKALNELNGIDVLHLRPGFFFSNFYGNISMIKHAGIIGANYGTDSKLILSSTNDIATAAAEELLSLSFVGKNVRYLASDEVSTNEVAQILGTAIDKPELPWIDFKDEDAEGGMIGAGLPNEVAKNYTEMGRAMREGKMAEDFHKHRPKTFGTTKLTDFAMEFAFAFNA